ncbi:hypothetical protein [Deinococcus cellulosilyticus]|uniref:Uncharacterized protein n=1 Tax=Deinococcus cellulosilyticus (strain DSM 18568 / NBRC 106333 / KACC 11606 / 5516J-15) TaxID=1223518 RepID=A0A511MX27_DEIC1|nr:hypothetical protein [Deinococcus cellulosilyticus]GEM44717.1 hypothetical protein DC3_03520 [Deinococcus cellulosilyticus NBRC 106333 = KACC 11606]
MKKMLSVAALLALSLAQAHPITSAASNAKDVNFDLVNTRVTNSGTQLVFQIDVSDRAGRLKPTRAGKLAGSSVYSYVWPTTLNSSTVGFEADQGVLALAVTSHPDFDDTPLFDEDGDSKVDNDGGLWHSHWVVLVPDDACGKGNLKVKDIPEGAKPRLPATWPGLPILIDSPGYEPVISSKTVTVKVPLKELGFKTDFQFDGVTAGLRVNESVHNPLLCVVDVFDVASGNLSLPGKIGK